MEHENKGMSEKGSVDERRIKHALDRLGKAHWLLNYTAEDLGLCESASSAMLRIGETLTDLEGRACHLARSRSA